MNNWLWSIGLLGVLIAVGPSQRLYGADEGDRPIVSPKAADLVPRAVTVMQRAPRVGDVLVQAPTPSRNPQALVQRDQGNFPQVEPNILAAETPQVRNSRSSNKPAATRSPDTMTPQLRSP